MTNAILATICTTALIGCLANDTEVADEAVERGLTDTSSAEPASDPAAIAGPGRYVVTYYFDSLGGALVGRCVSASPCSASYCEGHKTRFINREINACP